MQKRPGFSPDELKARYDVESITEDEWHSHSGQRTSQILGEYLSLSKARSRLLLNAGAGVHRLQMAPWEEIAVDLFEAPLHSHQKATCASIERLPFLAPKFGAVICVGEVLGYCDPAQAIAEFARVLEHEGVLICDFGNTHSIRYWFTSTYGRSADLITDSYNGTPERIWVYSPDYIKSVLASCGFEIIVTLGTHLWSALGRKLGVSPGAAVRFQINLEWLRLPTSWADILTVVAVRP